MQFSQNASALFSSPSSIGTQYNHYMSDSTDVLQQHSSTSPGVAEVNSEVVFNSNGVETPEGSGSSYELETRQAIKRLEEQLSLGDDVVSDVDPLYAQNESLDGLQFLSQPGTVYQRPENNKLERCYGGYVGGQYNVDPLYSQNESLDSLLSLDYVEDMAQPATGHQRPENNRLERSYGGYIGADYHPNNLTLVKNDSGTAKVTKHSDCIASACSCSLVMLSSLFIFCMVLDRVIRKSNKPFFLQVVMEGVAIKSLNLGKMCWRHVRLL